MSLQTARHTRRCETTTKDIVSVSLRRVLDPECFRIWTEIRSADWLCSQCFVFSLLPRDPKPSQLARVNESRFAWCSKQISAFHRAENSPIQQLYGELFNVCRRNCSICSSNFICTREKINIHRISGTFNLRESINQSVSGLCAFRENKHTSTKISDHIFCSMYPPAYIWGEKWPCVYTSLLFTQITQHQLCLDVCGEIRKSDLGKCSCSVSENRDTERRR